MPPMPQEAALGVVQVVPTQQPGQVAALHTSAWQRLFTQRSLGRQVTQRPPSPPHVVSAVPNWHEPTASTQPAQTADVQRNWSQRCPEPQLTQALLTSPHASTRLPGLQVPSSRQQPVVHPQRTPPSGVPASTTWRTWHECIEQTSPAAHTEHEAPSRPQAPCSTPDWHSPNESQHPAGHVVAVQSGGRHASTPTASAPTIANHSPTLDVTTEFNEKPSAPCHAMSPRGRQLRPCVGSCRRGRALRWWA